MSGNPIRFPPEISSDLFRFIENLEFFEFNATMAGDPVTEDQVRASNGSSCGSNGVIQQVHGLAFCVGSSIGLASGSSGGSKSVLAVALIIVGSILFFLFLMLFVEYVFCCRSGDGSDFAFTSRFKHVNIDLEQPDGVYGAGDGSGNGERSRVHGYELFDGEEDTYGYDDDLTGIDTALLQDTFLVTARIPYDAIRFGNCMKKGGFGVVYNGFYNRRRVAIKRLRNDRSGNLRNRKLHQRSVSDRVTQASSDCRIHWGSIGFT